MPAVCCCASTLLHVLCSSIIYQISLFSISPKADRRGEASKIWPALQWKSDLCSRVSTLVPPLGEALHFEMVVERIWLHPVGLHAGSGNPAPPAHPQPTHSRFPPPPAPLSKFPQCLILNLRLLRPMWSYKVVSKTWQAAWSCSPHSPCAKNSWGTIP